MNAAQQIRVLIADDHALLREGLLSTLRSQADMKVVGEVSDGCEAVEAFRRLKPDVLVTDLQMPRMSGLDVVITLRREFPAAKIVILTTYNGDARAARALHAGASGYLLKHLLCKDLIDTVRDVFAGQRRIPPAVAAEIAEHVGEEGLTDREISVLDLVARGYSNKRIAYALAVSVETVKAHMKNILCKLGANDRTHAVALAVKRGFLQL